jgi:hypothetical protein
MGEMSVQEQQSSDNLPFEQMPTNQWPIPSTSETGMPETSYSTAAPGVSFGGIPSFGALFGQSQDPFQRAFMEEMQSSMFADNQTVEQPYQIPKEENQDS